MSGLGVAGPAISHLRPTDWHPLVTGDPDSTHTSGNGIKGITLSETDIPEDDWEDYLIEETP